VAEVCQAQGEEWLELDVDAVPELVADFGWDVPVVRVDGRVLSVHRVSAGRLTAALVAAPGSWRSW
jgi:hypothetical protein